MKMSIVFVCLITALLILAISKTPYLSEKKMKKYVLDHQDQIEKTNNGYMTYLTISKTEYKYYTDISLKLLDENTYMLIFWGDRNTWKWGIKLDGDVTVDVRYQEIVKRKDVTLDKEVLKLIKDKLN